MSEYSIPQFEKDEGFSEMFRTAWAKFIDDTVNQEYIWTLTDIDGQQRYFRARIYSVSITLLRDTEARLVPISFFRKDDIRVVQQYPDGIINIRSLKDFDSVCVMTAQDKEKEFSREYQKQLIPTRWELVKKLYELNRRIVDINRQGLITMKTDDQKQTISWDKINKEFRYDLTENYLFVADKLLEGLTK